MQAEKKQSDIWSTGKWVSSPPYLQQSQAVLRIARIFYAAYLCVLMTMHNTFVQLQLQNQHSWTEAYNFETVHNMIMLILPII
jgi:hypothetical protein